MAIPLLKNRQNKSLHAGKMPARGLKSLESAETQSQPPEKNDTGDGLIPGHPFLNRDCLVLVEKCPARQKPARKRRNSQLAWRCRYRYASPDQGAADVIVLHHVAHGQRGK